MAVKIPHAFCRLKLQLYGVTVVERAHFAIAIGLQWGQLSVFDRQVIVAGGEYALALL